MARVSPTQKALKELRADGWRAEVVEKRLPIPGKFVTRDLFNCIDIIAMLKGTPLLAIQVTTRSHVANRLMKSAVMAQVWVSTGNNFQVWGTSEIAKATKHKTARATRKVRMDLSGEWIEIEEAS